MDEWTVIAKILVFTIVFFLALIVSSNKRKFEISSIYLIPNEKKKSFDQLPARFWIPRIGILIMILGILLQVSIGLPIVLFGFIETVGLVFGVVAYLIFAFRK